MKRVLLILLIISILLTAGCVGSDPTVPSTEPSQSTSETQGQTQAPSTVPTQDTTQEPTQTIPQESTQAPTQEPTQEPTREPTQEPTQEPTPEPTQGSAKPQSHTHGDQDDNGTCDGCGISLLTTFDLYNINDLHGKIADGENHPGVDELTTYLKNQKLTDDHVILLSSGDMWQGASESNMTKGMLVTDWMNELDFAAMTLGNHEYDWGEEAVEKNADFAEFPMLAINIYDRSTNKRVDYCDASVLVDLGAVQVGIIGAMGDCYSSIAPDKVEDVYFVVGDKLTQLVMAESERLRDEGADFIVYSIHDGYGSSTSTSEYSVTGNQLSSYYDMDLSNGYVDLVFEGHTHQQYLLKDSYGVYHLQNRGDNKGGISHAEVTINTVTGTFKVSQANLVSTSTYTSLQDDPIVEKLLDKYADEIEPANKVVGFNGKYRNSTFMRELVAELYLEAGQKAWGKEYDVILGGGFISIRSPYNLSVGDVTYSQLQSLFPFDNDLVLCSIKGRDLLNRFINTSNDNYYICLAQGIDADSIDANGIYYIVTDTYCSSYAPNKLTVVEEYDTGVYARDLLADYIADGGLSK